MACLRKDFLILVSLGFLNSTAKFAILVKDTLQRNLSRNAGVNVAVPEIVEIVWCSEESLGNYR